MIHLNQLDKAVLHTIKSQNLQPCDSEGYPFRPVVEMLASRFRKDRLDVYSSMKYLISLEAFKPGFDPKKPPKTGFYNIIDALRNAGNAKPIELPPVRKTEASRIVDKAITEHLAHISTDAKHFTKDDVLKIVDPLVNAMRELAFKFPNSDPAWANRVSATQALLEKVICSHASDFDYRQLQTVTTAVINDLREIETELEKVLPALVEATKEAKPPERTVTAEIMWGDETPMEKTEWLVPAFLPLGEPAGFTGEMDTRKSTVALSIAAAGSTGRSWFNNARNSYDPFTTLIAATEDSYASTILPRFIAAGGDAKRLGSIPLEIKVEQASKDGLLEYRTPFSLDEHLDMLADKIDDINLSERGPVRLIVFDPWISFLGAKDVNKAQEARVVMGKLKKFLEEKRLACINILHYNKTQGISSKQKTGGSSAVSEAHRMLWSFTLDEDDRNVTNITPVKKNLLEKATGHKITTVSKKVTLANGFSDDKGVVKYLGTFNGTADGELKKKEDPDRSKRKDIKQAILDELKSGRKEAGQVKFALKDLGSARTVERCADELESEGKLQRIPGAGRRVFWQLPEESHDDLF